MLSNGEENGFMLFLCHSIFVGYWYVNKTLMLLKKQLNKLGKVDLLLPLYLRLYITNL